MKYFFYPERRFVTFAPIMSNNPKSPIIDLQQQQLLLRMEYEYEKEEFKRQTETMGVARKVKRGLCWYPVSLGRSYYNSRNPGFWVPNKMSRSSARRLSLARIVSSSASNMARYDVSSK